MYLVITIKRQKVGHSPEIAVKSMDIFTPNCHERACTLMKVVSERAIFHI